MRKFLFPLLLATSMAATPAFAQQWNKQDRQTAREDRQAARQDREDARPAPRTEQPRFEAPQREFQAPQRSFAPQANLQAQERANLQRQQWSRAADSAPQPDRHFTGAPVQQRQWNRPAPDAQPDARYPGNADSVANWRQQQRDQMRQQRSAQDWRDQQRQFGETGQRAYTRVTPPAYARPDRPAPVPQTAYQYQGRSPQWNTNWRNDRRYDWRDYREHHRSVFRIGIYSDPFGWGYQRYNVGWRLYPEYYNQSFWLSDPYMYDLPYAPWPLQWVRYYDDALLVNVFTGQVVDVMYDFFW